MTLEHHVLKLDKNENIIVDQGIAGVFLIELSMFMTTQERQKTLGALSSTNFKSKTLFFNSFGVQYFKNRAPAEVFTSEDYDFMEYLETLGLSLEIAAQTAYLTNIFGETTANERRIAFDHFRREHHAIKLAQSGFFTGFTTFIPYYIISQWGGVNLALKAAIRENDDPQKLLELMSSIIKLQGEAMPEELSDIQFSVLMDFMSIDFWISSSYSQNDERVNSKIKRMSKFILDLVLSKIDWNLAASYASVMIEDENNFLDLKMRKFIKSTIMGPYTTKGNNSINGLIAILQAKYGPEALLRTFEVLANNENTLSYPNQEHFIAFTAIADFLAAGGNVNDPIDWMVSLEPSLDIDKFFERVYTKEENWLEAYLSG